MDAASSPAGVAAVPPTPPQWPAQTQWLQPPSDLPIRLACESAPAWSRPAQAAAGLLLVLALALLAWHAWTAQRWGCRPTVLEADALLCSSVDLNRADHVQLLQLPGVGESMAQRIEAYRAEHHGFRNVDELRQVKGIGPKLLEKMRPYVYVESQPSDVEDEPPARREKERNPPVVRKKVLPSERIDVNHATVAELRRLPGIGPTLSQRIVETREEKPFRSVEDLRRVRGIGAKTVERLRPHVVAGP
jgi:competence protein ComEA